MRSSRRVASNTGMAEENKQEEVETEETTLVEELGEALPDPNAEVVEDEEVVEAAPVEDEAVPEEEAEPEPAPSKLNEVFGEEVPEDHSDAGKMLLGSLTRDEVETELTPVAKELIRAVRIEAAKEVRLVKAELAQKEQQIAAREANLAKELRAMRAQRAELDRLFTDPEFQKAIQGAEGDVPEDPTSPEYIKHHAQTAVAERLREVFQPAVKVAKESAAKANWDQIVDKYPDLGNRESDLYKETMAQFNADKEAGRPSIGVDRYVALAQGNLARKREAERQKAMAAKRRESARRIQRTSAPNGQSAGPTEVPKHISKQGGAAVAAYLRENPSVRAAVEKAAGVGNRR